VAEVDNSLVDAHASDAASVITTDGAGQASVDVTVVGACEGKAAGEVVNVPVTVATDFATVVEAGDSLTIPVTCAGAAMPTRARRLTQRVTPNPATRRHRLRSTRTRSLPRAPWPARARTWVA